MIPVLIFVIVVLCWLSVCFRTCLKHPFLTVGYGALDAVNWIRQKEWRIPETGRIIGYTGMFRSGKTLSGVAYISELYEKYNDLKVYDRTRKKFVTQKVHILSNVDFKKIPAEPLISLEQVVYISNTSKQQDIDNDTLTIHIVFIDEASVQLNSRNFKSNMDPLFLNSLLTCGHVYMMVIYTCQDKADVDALLRRVTSYYTDCEKVWRVMVQRRYSAREMEYAANPMDVKPLSTSGWFIRNKDFEAYDTLACVENLKKSFDENDMMTEEEILALRSVTPPDMDVVQKPSKRYLRRRKKMNK